MPAPVSMGRYAKGHAHSVHGLITADHRQQKVFAALSQILRTGPGRRNQAGASVGLGCSVDIIQFQGMSQHGIDHGGCCQRIFSGISPDGNKSRPVQIRIRYFCLTSAHHSQCSFCCFHQRILCRSGCHTDQIKHSERGSLPHALRQLLPCDVMNKFC